MSPITVLGGEIDGLIETRLCRLAVEGHGLLLWCVEEMDGMGKLSKSLGTGRNDMISLSS